MKVKGENSQIEGAADGVVANASNAAVIDTAAEDAAFLAEMRKTEDGESFILPPEVPAVIENAEPPKVEQPVVENTEAAAAPERKEVIAGYTEEEIRGALEQLPLLKKALDTTNGTFGQRIAEQQKVLERLQANAERAVGKLTPEKLTRLSKEFPELAELLASDLNEVIAQGAQPQIDDSQIKNLNEKVQTLEEQVAKTERAIELKALTKAHPDWQNVAAYKRTPEGFVVWNNPAFGNWAQSQDEETRLKILRSDDADFLSEQLTIFKEAIKPKPVSKEKNELLEAAVMPKGVKQQVTVNTALSEEEAAYRAEMARR